MDEQTEEILRAHYGDRKFDAFQSRRACLKCTRYQSIGENPERDEKWRNTGLCTTCQIEQEPQEEDVVLHIEELDNILNVFLNDNGINGFKVVKCWDAPNLPNGKGPTPMRKITFRSPYSSLDNVYLCHSVNDAHKFLNFYLDVGRYLGYNEQGKKHNLNLFVAKASTLRDTINLCIRLQTLIERAANK